MSHDDHESRGKGPAFDHPPDSAPAPHSVPPERVILIPRPPESIWEPEHARPLHRKPRVRLAVILFLLTCLSTWWANGLIYSLCVMAVLLAHELGHYLQALRYGVAASLPFFIPFPISPFGTMGAVIVQQSGVADRKSMFDIAISGPLAGLVVALPLAYFGIRASEVVPIFDEPGKILIFSDPLLLKWMIQAVHGPIPPGTDLKLNPIYFAGWVGVFITGLNLIPIGQLDGGHILYCLIRRRAHYVARAIFYLAVGFVVYNVAFKDERYLLWSLMLVLIWLMGTRHPPTANDRMPLGWPRIVLGWTTLMFVFVGLTPMPMYEIESKPRFRPAIRRNVDRKMPADSNVRGERPV
jgi:membrane-associated protease RseP (regulator of RpoE activity)